MPKNAPKPAAVETPDIANMEPDELLKLVKKAGGQRAFSRKYAIPRTTLQQHLYKLRENPYQHRPAPVAVDVGQGAGVRRFIVSSAQDKTAVHEPFLANLEAYAAYLRKDGPVEIMIGGFTYSKKLFTENDPGRSWFEPRVRPYLINDRMRIDDRIDVCGEMNIRPTAEDPLSGLHTYTRSRWGIFPHAKVALRSVPTMKHDPAKIVMTTGTVTKPNYLPMKAGTKASFHHVYGAVLVEIAPDGRFYCRHLLGDDKDGSFYDLDLRVAGGAVTGPHRIKVLTPGDIHTFQVDPMALRAILGLYPTDRRDEAGLRIWEEEDPGAFDNMLDVLQPEHLMMHDVLDFKVRNHHDFNDPHNRFKLFVNGTESVDGELSEVAFLLTEVSRFRTWLNVHVVESNHDQALMKWLKHADYRFDPVNAVFFLKCQLAVYQAIQAGQSDFSIFENLMRNGYEGFGCEGVQFLREDNSLNIGGVEHACHGHRGLNGARGSAMSYAKIGPRVTKGHGHSAIIVDGVYEAGTTSLLDMGYNAGPSSWSHSSVVQYQNGRRAMITLNGGKWRV